MIIAVLLASGALAMLAWIVFNLSVYALPFFVGVSAASLAHTSGSGLIGAGVVGMAAGAIVLAVGQAALATIRSPALRFVTVGIYALPAAVAGYAVTRHVVAWTVPSTAWQIAFAIVGAVATAAVACARLTVAPSDRSGGARDRDLAHHMPTVAIEN